tara:strand:- start:270 stop:452 length:183 start_codon:yes stop_codon:yes gene_type:complete
LTWTCDECFSQKQTCESCAVELQKFPDIPDITLGLVGEDYETFNAIVVSREDFEFNEEWG